MTPLDALARILQLSQPLDRTFTATPDAKLPLTAIGQQVSAKVEELLPNGNFRVNINNQPLQMNLPQGTKVGNTIGLVLVNREPRLTFKLEMPQQNAPQLSDTGRLITQLLPDASKPNPPLTQANPILASPPSNPKQLAQSLQSTLAQSGLFYESHQAQWVTGGRPLAQLQQEPQNSALRGSSLLPDGIPTASLLESGNASPAALQNAPEAVPIPQETPGPAPSVLAPDTASANLQENPVKASPAMPRTVQPEQSFPAPQAMNMSAIQSEPRTTQAAPSSDSTSSTKDMSAANQVVVKHEMLPIVRQQIETLESREFNWSGQVWPGQNMDWQVKEESRGHQGSEMPEAWLSRLRLVLPMLGEVDANLKLTPAGVQISLQAANQVTENRLRDNGNQLVETLQAGGISVNSMAVKQHGG